MVKKESPEEPYRSSFLAKLANELAEEELNHAEIVSLLYVADERIKKYTGRNDQLLRLSQLADYAILKHIAEETVSVLTAKEILKRRETLDWIWPGWLHTTGQMIISSAPGEGKTQITSQMAWCLANANRFLGLRDTRSHKVAYVSLEMDWLSYKYIISHQSNEWDGDGDYDVIDEISSLSALENALAEREPTVIIIDSLTELLEQEEAENPRAAALRVMRWCRKIRRRYGCAMIIIHHNRKATEGNKKPKNLQDLEGSFQFGRVSETVLQLWNDHKGLELSAVKARFGKRESFYIERNENLWFTRKGESASKDDRGSNSDSKRDEGHSDSGNRHGDELHGFDAGSPPFRFGPPDKGK